MKYHNVDDLALALRKATLSKGGESTVPPGIDEFSWQVIADRYELFLREIPA